MISHHFAGADAEMRAIMQRTIDVLLTCCVNSGELGREVEQFGRLINMT